MDLPPSSDDSDNEQNFFTEPTGSVNGNVSQDLTDVVEPATFSPSVNPDSALLQQQIERLQHQHNLLLRRTEDDASERLRLNGIIDESTATNSTLSAELVRVSERTNTAIPIPGIHTNISGISGFNQLNTMGLLRVSANSHGAHFAVSFITGSTDFVQTDPGSAEDMKVSSVLNYIQKMCGAQGSHQFKIAISTFEDAFTSKTSTLDTRHAALVSFLQYLSSILSTPSVGRTIIFVSTRKFIAGTTSEQSRQIANIAHVYLLTEDSDEQSFITACGQKRIDSRLLETPINSYTADPLTLPGYRRLNSPDQKILFQSWINFIQSLFLYLFKGRSPCCREEELAKYSLSSPTCELHPIIIEGVLEENFEWFSRESSVFANLNASSILLGTKKIIPDDIERISLALEASPIEFRDTIYNLKKFDQRWSAIPYMDQPTNSTKPPIPKMTFSEFEILSLAAYEVFKQPPTNAKVSSIKSTTPASKQPNTGSDKKCARCKSKDHIAKDCATPPKEDCNRHKIGKCRNGTNCKYGHGSKGTVSPVNNANTNQSTTPPSARALPASGTTVYENNPADMTELPCRDCSKLFEYNSTWWSKQKGQDGTPWSPPFRCKECQALNKIRKQTAASALVTSSATPAPDSVTSPSPTTPPTPTPPPPYNAPAQQSAPTATLLTASFYSCIAEQMDSESDGDDDPEHPFCMVVASVEDTPTVSYSPTVSLSQDELSSIEEVDEEDDEEYVYPESCHPPDRTLSVHIPVDIPIFFQLPEAPEILIQPPMLPMIAPDIHIQPSQPIPFPILPECWCQPLSFDGQCTRCLRCPVCCACQHIYPYFRRGPAGQ